MFALPIRPSFTPVHADRKAAQLRCALCVFHAKFPAKLVFVPYPWVSSYIYVIFHDMSWLYQKSMASDCWCARIWMSNLRPGWALFASLFDEKGGHWKGEGIPSGKRLHSYGKSQFLMGKSTISMVIFNSYVKLSKGRFFEIKFCWLDTQLRVPRLF